MRIKKPHPTTFDQVRVTRDGEYADIEYLEPGVATTHFGRFPPGTTAEEIFERFNDGLLAMRELRLENPYFAMETPAGEPQIRFDPRSGQWLLSGDVLRGVISGSDDNTEPVIEVDEHDLSLREFGSLLSVFGGWGLRLVIVPDDELTRQPDIHVGGESWGYREESADRQDPEFIGDWRITEMELWEQADVDLMGPGYFSFDKESLGGFRFGAFEGALGCCQYSYRDGKPFVEFSWLGDDNGDMKNGRGWARMLEDGILEGRFLIQQGDESAFKARKADLPLRPGFKSGVRRPRGRC